MHSSSMHSYASWLTGSLLLIGGCQKEQQSAEDKFEPVKTALTITLDSPADDPTTKNAGSADPDGERIRKLSLATLSAAGFNAAGSLPTLNHRFGVPGKLRSPRDIAMRVMALKALFIWASAPESAAASERVTRYIERNGLKEHLTPEELKIISMPRQQALTQHGESIGWRLENMWSLCWLLGYDTPPNPTSGQLPDEVTEGIMFEFLPNLESSVDDLVAKSKP